MKSGNRAVSIAAFFLVAALSATDAGRVGEDGTGALWIAPELVPQPFPAIACKEKAASANRDLVFEKISLEQDHEPLAGVATAGGVSFDWNPETGELSFAAATPSGVFSDLESVALRTGLAARSCGSS